MNDEPMALDVTVSHAKGKTIYIIIDGKRRLGRLRSGKQYVSVGDGSLAFYDLMDACVAIPLTENAQ
jgi:hypothetical protein